MKEDSYEIVNFGDLIEGDVLTGSGDKHTEVTDVYQKHKPDRMYEIVMDDGEVVLSSGNHLWYTETERDLAGREVYREMALDFFNNNEVPNKLEVDEHYPLEKITNMFGNRVLSIVFIEQACRSLGHSSVTPHIVLENKLKDINEFEVNNYSYNNLIDFLLNMKNSILNGSGYFYYGEVRSTDDIANLISNDISVNIPHKKDLK